jgi:hypothetical protein
MCRTQVADAAAQQDGGKQPFLTDGAHARVSESKRVGKSETTEATLTTFISYSWDSEAHKEWVLQFGSSLRAHGLAVILDQWHCELGDRLPQFMEESVAKSEIVLVVCTPEYKDRFDRRLGGVGYEGHIISANLIASLGVPKFIPVLRLGDWNSSLPAALSGIKGIDLRGEQWSTTQYEALIEAIHRVKVRALSAKTQ